jgi:uncharacterized protein (DUF58 family)
MSFSEVREYVPGDDVKSIDWNVTARMRTPFVKVFEEERELTVILLVDCSASTRFGTKLRSKDELLAEVGATLLLSAAGAGDRTGLLLFTDKIESFIPPQRGRRHVMRQLRELVTLEDKKPSAGTDVAGALRFLDRVMHKRSIVFVLSDFDAPAYHKELLAASHRHDLVGLRPWDVAERELPQAGLIQVQDAESGRRQWIDTDDGAVRKAYTRAFDQRREMTESIFNHCGAPLLHVATGGDPALVLQNFFETR